ncbi:hypothetical protein CVV38_03605 [Candidatus Peregrinibacteria bacterium HGW-Peregrinibacteria-1]|jgi:ribosomal protein S21|nr:MAG: hypothetical protein CVV38_03605 [Candidatus Peregrinibacteria bacterium HGW-Peregrinibacteria-1]
MQVVVQKREGESNERMITRFNKLVQGSRKVYKIRKSRYFQKDATRRQVRDGAVKREEYRALRKKNQYY